MLWFNHISDVLHGRLGGDRRSRTPAVMAVMTVMICVVGVTACDSPDDPYSREVYHCANVAGHASTEYEEITVVGVREWVLGDMRYVQLRFQYPPIREDSSIGVIKCGYAYAIEQRSDPNRILKVAEVHFHGRYLSESELNYVNTSLFTPRPEFKIND